MERVQLTQGPIGRDLLRFALPTLLGNVLQSINASVNSMWVGHFLGEAALTATSVANTLVFLLVGASYGLALAATIFISQCIGANDERGAKRVVGTSASVFAIFSMLVAVAGWLLARPLLEAMNTPSESLLLAVSYMRVIFLAMPFMYLYAFVMSALRGAGDAQTPLRFMLLSIALDVILNPLLIFGLGFLPRLGIMGAALATFFAQGVSLFALVRHLYRRENMLTLRGHELAWLRIDWKVVAFLVRKGVPMGSEILVTSLSGVLMTTLVNRFQVDTAAAFGASLQLWNYIQMPAVAMGLAVSAMVAQNVGAGKWDRVAATAHAGVFYGVCITSFVVIVLLIASRKVLALFLPSGSEALHIAEHLNRIAAWSFIPLGISMVLSGVVRATGAATMPLAITAIAFLLVRFPLAALLIQHQEPDAIWWSFPISSLVAAALAALYYTLGRWRVEAEAKVSSSPVKHTVTM